MFIFILFFSCLSVGVLWAPSLMAFFQTSICCSFAVVALLLIAAPTTCNSQKNPVQVEGEDPVQIVAKALVCFNNRLIYANCEESYRLSEKGTINVPSEATDEYCNGPCLDETKLVLNCIDGVLSHFLFYNKATVQDVRITINAACSDSSERGNFDVASHIQGENSHAHQIGFSMYTYVYMAMIAGGGLFL
ncbi:dnaJ subfamily A member 1 [Cinnamomum micranthum f. kanehirae]|uniref:DnaJ subfamily A member 1 n=1 Tax=Cinnamomum micranthum f. kanehirae TaxID=337451 RepID=A0A3S3PN03_9MAGN|nr:dnaJ subfamily A member 1 [Cinnamomum micranthum f. kanehirae]